MSYRPIVRGEHGWRVYALQRAIGVVPATGTFGAVTQRRLKRWQRKRGLYVDGVAGPATQARIVVEAGETADRAYGLPEGVGHGIARTEGLDMIAPTNWGAPGGVDCGAAQWRVAGAPFALSLLKRAFQPYRAIRDACRALRQRQREFMERNSALRREPWVALQVAALAHNWPAGADQIARRYRGEPGWWRLVDNPDAPASWIPGHTHSSWAREYPARILRFTA